MTRKAHVSIRRHEYILCGRLLYPSIWFKTSWFSHYFRWFGGRRSRDNRLVIKARTSSSTITGLLIFSTPDRIQPSCDKSTQLWLVSDRLQTSWDSSRYWIKLRGRIDSSNCSRIAKLQSTGILVHLCWRFALSVVHTWHGFFLETLAWPFHILSLTNHDGFSFLETHTVKTKIYQWPRLNHESPWLVSSDP